MLTYVGAIVWGALAGQFLIQTVTSFANALIAASGFVGSNVDKSMNAIGVFVGIVQAAVFAAMLAGGTWLSMRYVQYGSWDALSTTTIAVLALSILYCLVQVPEKLFVSWMIAWVPNFYQESMRVPPGERIAHARWFWLEKRSQR